MNPMPVEETKRAPNRNKRLFEYALRHKKIMGIGLLILLIGTLFDLLGPYIIRYILDHQIPTNSDSWNKRTLFLLLVAYLASSICASIGRYAGTIFMQKASNGVVASMRNDLYRHIQKLSIAFFDQEAAGSIVSRITNDTEAVRQLYVNVLATFATSFFYIISINIIMVSMKPVLALASSALLPLILGIIWLYSRLSSTLLHKYRKKRSQLNALLNETISGMSIIQAFHHQKQTTEEFEEINSAYFRYLNHLMKVEAALSFNITSFMREICFALLILLFGRQVLGGYDFASAGVLYLFIDYVTKIFNQVQNIMSRLSNMQRAVVASDHIFNLMDVPEEREEPKDTPSRSQISMYNANASGWKNHGSNVQFHRVTFAYQEKNWVLQNISFEAKPGETVAFVGHTGSGKSSVMNLLLRYYEPQKGHISINEKDISTMSRGEVRTQMAIVLQDPYLFTGTLYSNIALDNPKISEEKATQALLAVGGQDLLDSLPHGMDESVTERGSTLSSGQRQLISFARALAYDPQILILDEATASIDSETESLIQKAMEVVQKGRTTFIIAHRLSTIKNAHQILVLDKGHIVEQGTHDQLIALHGRYHQMYRLQSSNTL